MTELDNLAIKYGSDKYGHHNYTPIYDANFSSLKNENMVLLEIGIGGYEYVDRGGSSLKMWRDYFPNAIIHGVDIYDKSFFNDNRIFTHIGSQDDSVFLHSLINKIGSPTICIDDGSHVNDLTIKTFEILFPVIKPGGIYVVEDVHTSYWPDIYGGDFDVKNHDSRTTMNYFQSLTDVLNAEHIPGYVSPINDIESISFYKEMIIIKKKI